MIYNKNTHVAAVLIVLILLKLIGMHWSSMAMKSLDNNRQTYS